MSGNTACQLQAEPRVETQPATAVTAKATELYGLKICRAALDEGDLERLLEMPLDVFFEVSSYLTPLDLLNLARASSLSLGSTLVKTLTVPKEAHKHILNMLPAALSYIKKRKRLNQNLEDFFHKSEFASVWQEYRDIRGNEDKPTLRRFVSDRKAAAFERVNFHIAMVNWEILCPKLVKMIDDERMRIRWDAMLKRVKEAGKCEELLEKYLPGAWNTIDNVVF
ncbi:hypothetical protein BD413DRAFT_667255 [Trametes elegans]|nr:hypothetical protein BD413DRAFT_667255 [Trametes elegans]